MANALIVRRPKALVAQDAMRAAQYVRMSTDYQRYSIENQAAVIATYAQVHGFRIVRTYRDEGQSGLKLKNRAGLIQLLDDVQSGDTDFRHILVYDVSRWGRFQDTDESAHYEFLCKKAGFKIAYCAEQFDNDGTMMSSILKNLKRVMAAEYSRELSIKIHAGALRFARMGFRTSGEVGYGLRRQLVDERQRPKAVLQRGDRKYLLTDHVRVLPGPANEVAVVRWIFQQFLRHKSQRGIACELNQKGIPTNTDRSWNGPLIGRVLRNECYVGNLIYNRQSRREAHPQPAHVVGQVRRLYQANRRTRDLLKGTEDH
jgi:DNA invertase Pin-like site-specific DNA recombinase